MNWPSWIETLRERFLADEASVFLLYGPEVTRGRWQVEGEEMDCAHLMVHFLSKTRPVVGLFRRQIGLQFPGIGDVGAFDRLVALKDFADGEVLVLSDDVPEEALGKIWRALSSGSDQSQGYVIAQAEKLWPLGKKHQMEIKGAPEMSAWPHEAVIRRSNNVIVLLSDDLDQVAPELVNAASVIEVAERNTLVPDEVAEPAPTKTDLSPEVSDPEDEMPSLDDGLSPAEEDVEEEPPPAPEGELPDDLEERLDTAIRAALPQYAPATFPDHLPVMHGVAAVFAELFPGRCGALTFGLDEEEGVYANGDGADWFLQTWESDITFNAAADMLVKELQPPENGYTADTVPALPETPIRVLAKRIRKLTA